MGFNTVAFLLNDYMYYLKESPKTVAWMLAHPPLGKRELQDGSWREMVRSVAKENSETAPHDQVLEILPTFHADHTTFLRAGGNCISELKVLKYSKTKDGKATVTLELPDWASPKKRKDRSTNLMKVLVPTTAKDPFKGEF